MKEEKVWLENSKGQRMAGILTLPYSIKTPPLILVVHGYGGYAFDGMFAKIASNLANSGFAVFRFMFAGYTPSEGNSSDITIEREVDDLISVYNFIRTLDIDQHRIGIIGQSLGCYVSLLAKLPVKCYVFLSPAIDLKMTFSREFKDILPEIEEKGSAKIGSRTIYKTFWDSAEKYGFSKEAREIKQPILIVYGDKDKRVTPPEIKSFYGLLHGPKKLQCLKGGVHVFIRDEKYRLKTIQFITTWFKKYL